MSKSSKQRVGSPSSTYSEIISTELKMARQSYLGNWSDLSICYLYQDNLSSSKIILKSAKTEQVKHSLSKINLAQQYDADKLYIIIQIPTPYMIADTLTKPEATHNYASFEVNRLRVYALPI